MKNVVTEILVFSEQVYPFFESALKAGQARQVEEPAELLEVIKKHKFPIMIFDTSHSRFSRSLMMRVYRQRPLSEFWLVTDHREIELPEFLVDDTLTPLIRKAEFETRIKSCLRIRDLLRNYHMVGKSANLKRVAEMISQVAPTNMSTLIIGPSGSGKELAARAVHNFSRRKGKTFLAVNCGALAESLLESELFGYEKGAFTGAIGRKEGIFKRADGGTVFLDEIGETSPALQVKLLRVLEGGTFYRVGGGDLVKTDVRLVAATNRDLTEAIAEGEFREDLYFRLGAIRINLTGLADRKADIIPLINHFFEEESGERRGISEKALELLVNYGWPGNVRQLRNFVNRMLVVSPVGEISENMVMQFIEEQGQLHRNLPVVTGKKPQEAEFQLIYQALLSLGQEVRMLRDLIVSNIRGGQDVTEVSDAAAEPNKTVEEMEKELIEKTLDSVGGNRREAARILGIGERTLYRKLKKYGEI